MRSASCQAFLIASYGDDATVSQLPWCAEPTRCVIRVRVLKKLSNICSESFYYGHFYGWDRTRRDRYREHPHFHITVDFCARWDQSSFDKKYLHEPLETFIPSVKRIFSRKPYWYQNKVSAARAGEFQQ